jgi:hypothetical protein
VPQIVRVWGSVGWSLDCANGSIESNNCSAGVIEWESNKCLRLPKTESAPAFFLKVIHRLYPQAGLGCA